MTYIVNINIDLAFILKEYSQKFSYNIFSLVSIMAKWYFFS